MSTSDLYIYAFTDTDAATETRGLADMQVHTFGGPGVFAVVSDLPAGRLRPQRRHLAAHQRVLTDFAKTATTLPVAFGMATSPDELESVLEEHGPAIADQLASVAGCVEITVTLRWDVDDVFAHLVAIDEELRNRRDELVSLGDRAPHDLKVAIGRRVEAVLAGERHAHAQQLRDLLTECARDSADADPTDEASLASVVLLIERDRLDGFDAALKSAASAFGDHYALQVSGPFAPHHFVDLDLGMHAAA